jgi:hypothetical protein
MSIAWKGRPLKATDIIFADENAIPSIAVIPEGVTLGADGSIWFAEAYGIGLGECTDDRSILRIIYIAIFRPAGFGPTSLILLVGAGRFERPTPCAQGRCATRLRYAPTFYALRWLPPAALFKYNLLHAATRSLVMLI